MKSDKISALISGSFQNILYDETFNLNSSMLSDLGTFSLANARASRHCHNSESNYVNDMGNEVLCSKRRVSTAVLKDMCQKIKSYLPKL